MSQSANIQVLFDDLCAAKETDESFPSPHTYMYYDVKVWTGKKYKLVRTFYFDHDGDDREEYLKAIAGKEESEYESYRLYERFLFFFWRKFDLKNLKNLWKLVENNR